MGKRIEMKQIMLHGQLTMMPYDNQTEEFINATLASLVFPSEKNGCLLAMAQTTASFTDQAPAVHLIAEHESGDIEVLLLKLIDWQKTLALKTVVAPMNDSVRMYLSQFKRQRMEKRQLQPIDLMSPSHYDESGNISYHLQMLRGALKPESQRLFIPERSVILGYLKDIPAGIGKVKDADYPAVAALAYGYDYMTTHFGYDPIGQSSGPGRVVEFQGRR